MRAPTGLAAVAAREIAWIRRDPVARLLVLVMPLLAFGLLAATFSRAVIRDLRVEVVDADRSALSAQFVQAIDATPGVEVASRSSDLTGAMQAIHAGRAIAAIYIPPFFERDFEAGRRPQLVDLYNRQFFTPGNLANGAVQSAVAGLVAGLPRPPGSGRAYAPGPLVPEPIVLTNPALNYAQFLLRATMPTVLHVMVGIAGAFAVGSEFGRRRTLRAWRASAGGSALVALLGKLLPYAGFFAVTMAIGAGIIHGVLGIPFRGDALLTAAAALLLILAYLAIGALFVLLVRSLAVGLALVGILCSPAFGFAGVGFPLLAMNGFSHAWGSLLPLRWYIQILFDQAARGVAPRESVGALLVLAALTAGFLGLAWLRTRQTLRSPPPPVAPAAPLAEAPRGVVVAALAEYRRVLGDSGARGLIVLGPLLYAALYPQPYVGQLARDLPIAVVDDDATEVSRSILQALDAHEAIRIAAQPQDLTAAQAAIDRREVFGVVGIPSGTQRDVLKGRPAHLPVFVDATYLLVYSRTLQGITEATAAVSGGLQAGPTRMDGSAFALALARSSPVEFLATPLFNPTGAYGAYVVPAAFTLILQQTLVMGVATLGGVAYERGGAPARRRRGRIDALAGQSLAHLALALPAFALYLTVLPHVYGYAANQRVLDLLLVALPFVLAVSLLGQAAGALARRRETAAIVLTALGLPLFFLVGVAWPPEAIPPAVRLLSHAVPSTFGIDALVRINQTGASLAEVGRDWISLWSLVLVYGVLAWLAARRGASPA